MGNDNNQDSKNGLISVLLLIMLITGAAINNPLTSSLPFDSQNFKLISPEVHKVDARLWQDPIASVEKHILQIKKTGKGQWEEANSFDNFIKKIPGGVNENTGFTVIAVSVFGSSYSELVEFRQRYRYAVVSALGSRDYFPQDNEHLDFFLLNTHLANNCEVYVPYEWFESGKTGKKEQILILWLNEEKIVSTQYGNFVRTLFDQFSEASSKKVSFTLIGPTKTSKLVELIKSTEIDGLPVASFKIISSSATISDRDLFDVIREDNQREKALCPEKERDCVKGEIAKKLADKSIIRTIGQDENLAKALVWELEQRGVNRIPFVLMLLIAIGRSDLFDNQGFSPALIIVFIGASTYLIITLILLRKSAEKQCEDILKYYEEYRPGRIYSAFGNASIVDQVVTEIRNEKQKVFARFLQRPSLLALLLPGGGIGLTSIIEYLYN